MISENIQHILMYKCKSVYVYVNVCMCVLVKKNSYFTYGEINMLRKGKLYIISPCDCSCKCG